MAVRQEGDEHVCEACTCGKGGPVRWSVDELNDVCPQGPDYVAPSPSPPTQPRPNLIIRVCGAMGVSPRTLARMLKVSYKTELEPLLSVQDAQLGDLDHDECMHKLMRYVDERTGKLLAIRQDMQSKLQQQRQARAARRASIANR